VGKRAFNGEDYSLKRIIEAICEKD
jgi:hypothetical protein